jgi:hypothetical protein
MMKRISRESEEKEFGILGKQREKGKESCDILKQSYLCPSHQIDEKRDKGGNRGNIGSLWWSCFVNCFHCCQKS